MKPRKRRYTRYERWAHTDDIRLPQVFRKEVHAPFDTIQYIHCTRTVHNTIYICWCWMMLILRVVDAMCDTTMTTTPTMPTTTTTTIRVMFTQFVRILRILWTRSCSLPFSIFNANDANNTRINVERNGATVSTLTNMTDLLLLWISKCTY